MRQDFYPLKQPLVDAIDRMASEAIVAGEDPFDVHCNIAEAALAALRLYAIRQVAKDARDEGQKVEVPDALDASDRLASLVSSNSVVLAISTMKSEVGPDKYQH